MSRYPFLGIRVHPKSLAKMTESLAIPDPKLKTKIWCESWTNLLIFKKSYHNLLLKSNFLVISLQKQLNLRTKIPNIWRNFSESFEGSPKKGFESIPIPKKVGFDANHDSDSTLL